MEARGNLGVRIARAIHVGCTGLLVVGLLALGVWGAVKAGGGANQVQMPVAAVEAREEPIVRGAGAVPLPTDLGDFDDMGEVRRLIAELTERGGYRLGMSCYEDPGVPASSEVPPFMIVARDLDGECVLGGFVSRGQIAPMAFGPLEARGVPGWEPPWDSVPIFDEQGNVIGDMSSGTPMYFDDVGRPQADDGPDE